MKRILTSLVAVVVMTISATSISAKQSVMLDLNLAKTQDAPFLLLNDAAKYSKGGLMLAPSEDFVKLDKFYSLAERMVRYRIKPSDDAVVMFRSSTGDFQVKMDVPEKKVTLVTSAGIQMDVPFLKGGRSYDVEIQHIYNKAVISVKDVRSGKKASVSAVNDGPGGCGQGKLQDGFSVGLQWDHYWFGLQSGTSALVKRITVLALKDKVKLLIYGDSITQPEGYFPEADFHNAWTQRIISALDGNAMSSGRGGCQIKEVIEFIQNELPYIKTDYVMITIGTNGGNTEENLTQLVEYVKSRGVTPILNNIPSNESGTQIATNEVIAKVREKTGVKGCLFDLVTSMEGDGKEVDKSLMFFEDLWEQLRWLVYHHPNGDGGARMFERTLVDVPEIYQ